MGIDSFTVDVQDLSFTARDGLKLFARRYGPDTSTRRPLLCLAGLTRNGRDFTDVARSLAHPGQDARIVYTLDYRGRGSSEFDSDWKNYAVPLEMLDVLDFMTFAGLSGAGLLGTSRGGLIAMLLACARPTAIGAVILNDIGPVIETDGLVRIAGYVGRTPLPNSWRDAARMTRDMSCGKFPAVPEAQWEEVARQLYNERDGRPAPGYDPALGRSLSVLDGPMPALWPQFEALKRYPLLVIRGELSDILSAATVEEMGRRHPMMATIEVPGQGHAPLLKDPATIGVVRQFLEETDGVGR